MVFIYYIDLWPSAGDVPQGQGGAFSLCLENGYGFLDRSKILSQGMSFHSGISNGTYYLLGDDVIISRYLWANGDEDPEKSHELM